MLFLPYLEFGSAKWTFISLTCTEPFKLKRIVVVIITVRKKLLSQREKNERGKRRKMEWKRSGRGVVDVRG